MTYPVCCESICVSALITHPKVMFSTTEKIKNRMGQNKVGRFQYLKLLKEEFQITKSPDAKHQTIANLANFSYDPVNYEHLRTLGIIDLFLEQLSEEDPTIIQFALGGICNLALDVENKEHIISSGGISHISWCLRSSCVQTVMYAVTTLMFLISVKSRAEITCDSNVAKMLELSTHSDKRVQNLAEIFLEDFCSGEQIHRVRNSISLIPLPPNSITPSTSQQ